MYKIIGSDGKEYGPVSAQQLREWISQGRVNGETQVLAEGNTTWKPLSEFPEFMVGAAPSQQAAAPITAATQLISAASQVSGPATALMVTAIVGALSQAVSIVMHFVGMSFAMMQPAGNMPQAEWMRLLSGPIGIAMSFVALVTSAVVLIGALKMKKLESYGLAMAASIIALVPCVSPCCWIGLPIGIWALVVLSKPEVKAAFHQNI